MKKNQSCIVLIYANLNRMSILLNVIAVIQNGFKAFCIFPLEENDMTENPHTFLNDYNLLFLLSKAASFPSSIFGYMYVCLKLLEKNISDIYSSCNLHTNACLALGISATNACFH